MIEVQCRVGGPSSPCLRVQVPTPRRPVVREQFQRILLGLLAAASALIGVWAGFAPRSFYDDFPGTGNPWVSPDGPFNEHLVRDVGWLNLALALVALVAAITLARAAVIAAAGAAIVAGVPHLAYHVAHLDLYGTADQIGNVVSLSLGPLVGVILLLLTVRRPERATTLRAMNSRVAARPNWRSHPPTTSGVSTVAKLIYVTNVSLDSFIEDEHGSFDWTEPDDEQFAFITDLIRPVGTYLYGRRLYESMAVWETEPALAAQSELRADFAHVWQAADKIVYSTTLDAVSTAKSRLEGRFDPDVIREVKDTASRDLMIGGANFAAQAFHAGLIDECHLFIGPAIVGGGKPSLPSDLRVELELLDERRFDNGVVYVRHRILH